MRAVKVIRSCRSLITPSSASTLAEKNNEPLAISSVYGDILLSGFLSLRPSIPSQFSEGVPTADTSSNRPLDLDLRFHVPAKTPSQRDTRMHVRPMHVLRFTKGGGDTYDGQAFDISAELQ